MDVLDELRQLYEADQKARAISSNGDEERLARAKELLGHKESLSSEELYYLAMLFQHGETPDEFKQALDLATAAAEGGYEPARWLSAAAEDRYLCSKGKKQKWGTQFKLNEKTGEYEQQPMARDEESGITDEMREKRGVPPRDQQLKIFLERKDT